MTSTVATETVAAAPLEASVNQNGTDASKGHEEHQYLDLVREILDVGEHRPDR